MYPSSEPIDPSVLRLVQGKSLVRIVDDDETVAKSYEFMLRCSGWNCRIFNSAEDYLASENVQIGCLILDVRMPGLSGLQLQQKLEILEREVAQLLAQGLLYKQIAEKLGCSERTVKFHKARIAEKLGVKTPAEIALKLSNNLY